MFTGFRCCYCFGVNEARKQRPNAPRLNLDTTIGSASEDELSAAGDDDETDDGVDGENGELIWVFYPERDNRHR